MKISVSKVVWIRWQDVNSYNFGVDLVQKLWMFQTQKEIIYVGVFLTLSLYILLSTEANTFSNNNWKFMCVRFMAILCPSTAIYHFLFSSLLFFSCYVSGIPVYGAEEGKDGFHSTPVSSLLPKNKCSASARGEVRLTPKILCFHVEEGIL